MAKVTVRRSNEVLKIEEYLVQSYVDNGYDVLDESGAVIKKAIPSGTVQLKAEVIRLTAKVAELEKKLAEKEAQSNVVTEEVEKPKRRKKADD